ncbi:hypothetical protein ACPOLB_19400 [Rubrivivax sp. RP6-9]|uniref:hypothetical protein n=1 Tax=Rubrivivax sp. RP6-9 TaxID=3415750 RepID=UPI003CC55799
MPVHRLFCAGLLAAFVALLVGCAHPISLNPDISKLQAASAQKIQKGVGLQISDEERQREVTTPGGGGDKVRYQPYRDLEAGLYVVLSQSFANVVQVAGATDPKVMTQGLHYIVRPTITTNSSSSSLLTWPPTAFTVDVVCRVEDLQGRLVKEVRASAEGKAEFSEFKNDFSLSAKRAADAALVQLLQAFQTAAAELQ